MTIEEAREQIPHFGTFRRMVCSDCPFTTKKFCLWHDCDEMNKARAMDFNRILKCYARHDGEMHKVLRWLKQARI